MKSFYDIKTAENSVKDVDTTSRRVKVVISEMMSKDLDNDVIDIGAYDKTLQERGPKGKSLIWHLTDHYPSLKYAVGKPSEIFVDGQQLVMITDVPKTQWGNDMLEFYSTGMINQHSIGFRTIKKEPMLAGTPEEYTLIKEILLYEGSAVLWGANPNTPTLSVGKSLNKTELTKRYETLEKLKSSGNFSDEIFPILDAQLKETQQQIVDIFLQDSKFETTQPIAQAITQPDVKDFVKQVEIQNLLTALKSLTCSANSITQPQQIRVAT
jgi:HK97 family phage prohead protease